MVFSYWFVLSYKNIKKIFTFWHTCLLFILKSACYSETKYYLCKQNNKRSLLGRKQRSRVARSFPNRYLFGLCDKVTSLFSTSCILDIILGCNCIAFGEQKQCNCFAMPNLLQWNASCAECHSFSIKMNTHHNRCFPIFVQIIAS